MFPTASSRTPLSMKTKTPKRCPLFDVDINAPASKEKFTKQSAKKQSQLPDALSLEVCSPKDRQFKFPRLTYVYSEADSDISEQDDLNAVIEHVKQDYETKLNVKDQLIDDLSSQLQMMKLLSPDVQTQSLTIDRDVQQCLADIVDTIVNEEMAAQSSSQEIEWPSVMPSDEQISMYIDDIIQQSIEVVRNEQMDKGNDNNVATIPAVEVTSTVGVTVPIMPHPRLDLAPVFQAGWSPVVVTKEDMGTCMTPALLASPVVVTKEDTGTCMTPVVVPHLCDAMSSPHPRAHLYHDAATITTPALKRVTDQGCSPLTPDTRDTASSPHVPRKINSSVATMTTPNQHSTVETMMTPKHHCSAETMVTPKNLQDSGVNTTKVQTLDFAMYTSLGPTLVDSETATTPCMTHAAETMVTPKSLVSTAASPIPLDTKDQSLGMTPIKGVDQATSPTPLETKDECFGVTPIRGLDQGTLMTPATTPVNTETMTTPLTVPTIHFMDNAGGSEDRPLLRDLQSRSLTNELLRKEIADLKQTKLSLNHDLTQAKVANSDKDKKIGKLEEEVAHRNAIQKDVDDLMIQTSCQLNEIGELKSLLSQKTEAISGLEEEKQAIKDQYQTEIHNLQEDLSMIYRQHKKEISSLKEDKSFDYERLYNEECMKSKQLEKRVNIYKSRCKTVSEFHALQTAKENSLVTTSKLLKDAAVKNKRYGEALNAKELHLKMREDELVKHKREVELQTADNQALRDQVKEAIQEKQATQVQYEDSMSQLHEATAQVAEIVVDVHLYEKELETLKGLHQKVKEENAELREKEHQLFLEGETIAAALQVQEVECSKEQNRANMAEKKNDQFQKIIEQSLASFEEDMNSMTKTIKEQETVISKQAQELEKNKNLKLQCSCLEEQLQSKEFLEQEHIVMVESLKETEEKLEVDHLELNNQCAKLKERSEECNQMRSTIDKLVGELEERQNELDSTKAQAQWMLFKQGNEMTTATQEMTSLRDDITTMAQMLRAKLGISQDTVTKKDTVTKMTKCSEATTSGTQSSVTSSLVSSVLSAVRHSDVEHVSDDPERRLEIGGSDGSAFQPVANPEAASCTSGGDVSGTVIGQVDDTLGEQLSEIRKMVTDVAEMVQLLESAGLRTIQELNDNAAILTKNMDRLKERYDYDIQLVRDQLKDCENREKKLQHDVKSKRTELFEKEESLEYSNKKINELVENLSRFSDQQLHIQKMSKEIEKLSSECLLLKKDNTVINKELVEALDRIEELTKSCGLDSNEGLYLKEKMALKREVERLKLHVIEKDEYYQSQNTRAIRQAKTLEHNWKQAEEEVYKLDEMLEVARKTLEEEHDVILGCPKLRELSELLGTEQK